MTVPQPFQNSNPRGVGIVPASLTVAQRAPEDSTQTRDRDTGDLSRDDFLRDLRKIKKQPKR